MPLKGGGRGVVAMLALALAFAAFVSLFVTLSLGRPLCCADDAAHAVVAKNLASGYGYANTLGHNTSKFEFRRFDPVIGTGPTIILPAAAAIWLFGDRASVPGLASIVVWVLLCLALYRVITDYESDRTRVAAAGVCFLFLCLVLSPYNAPQWFALLGEVPTALLLLLALAVLAGPEGSIARKEGLAGLLLGLAVVGKLLSILYALPALAFVAIGETSKARPSRGARIALFAGGVVAPLLAFEAWKAFTLGSGYLESSREFVNFVSATGLATDGQGIGARVGERMDSFRDRYGVPLGLLVLLVAASGWRVLRGESRALRALFVLAAAGAAVHLAYWLLASNGNPRYAFGAMLVMAALASLGLLASRARLEALVLGAALVAVAWTPVTRVPFYLSFHSPAALASGRSAVELAAEFLDREREGKVVLTQWWATAAALEYASSEVWIFDGYPAYGQELRGTGTLVAYSEHFLQKSDEGFANLLRACGAPVFEAAPYKVHRC